MPRSLVSRNRLESQSGAFDLPSILVGVVVVGILATGVFAAIFGVMPWSQSGAAKQDLASVHTAQTAAYVKDGGFRGKAALVGAGWLGADVPENLVAHANPDGQCYVAVTTSETGDRFMVSNETQTPRPLAEGDTWCSGTLINDTTPVMISTWNTGMASTCKDITLPVTGFKGTVDWGDGTTDAKTTHTFTTAGPVHIRIDGTFDTWGSAGWADAPCLVSVDRWGATETSSLRYGFANADNLRHVESIPIGTTDLGFLFIDIDSDFTIGVFDTSKVKSMSYMFQRASKFNQPVEFDTSETTTTSGMFWDAPKFNQPVNFDTSKVTTMSYMFQNASSFNQPVNFDTGRVTTMYAMFWQSVAFNHPVPFDTSGVTTMYAMFYGATSFNQPVAFDTSSAITLYAMFQTATAFNQPLAFNTSKAVNLAKMFNGATAFNQDLSAWKVSQVNAEGRALFDGMTPAWKLPRPKWS